MYRFTVPEFKKKCGQWKKKEQCKESKKIFESDGNKVVAVCDTNHQNFSGYEN